MSDTAAPPRLTSMNGAGGRSSQLGTARSRLAFGRRPGGWPTAALAVALAGSAACAGQQAVIRTTPAIIVESSGATSQTVTTSSAPPASPDDRQAFLTQAASRFPGSQYIVGYGTGSTGDDAERRAVIDAAAQIRSTVKGNISSIEEGVFLSGRGETSTRVLDAVSQQVQSDAGAFIRPQRELTHPSAGVWEAVAVAKRSDLDEKYVDEAQPLIDELTALWNATVATGGRARPAVTTVRKLIAVLPLDISNAQAHLTKAGEANLEDALRDGASTQLTGWTVLNGATTIQILVDNGIDPTQCGQGSSQLAQARQLEVNKFVSGVVQYVDGNLAASIRLEDTRSGRTLATAELAGPTVTALRQQFATQAADFFSKAVFAGSSAAPKAATVAGWLQDARASCEAGGLERRLAVLNEERWAVSRRTIWNDKLREEAREATAAREKERSGFTVHVGRGDGSFDARPFDRLVQDLHDHHWTADIADSPQCEDGGQGLVVEPTTQASCEDAMTGLFVCRATLTISARPCGDANALFTVQSPEARGADGDSQDGARSAALHKLDVQGTVQRVEERLWSAVGDECL